MKYRILFLFYLSLFFSCTFSEQEEAKSTDVKSTKEPVQETTPPKLQIAEVDTMVEEASFMQFFESFMWDDFFQKTRTDFPIYSDKVLISDSSSWTYLPFFTNTYAIPIIHDDTLTYFDKDIETEVVTMSVIDIYQSQSTDYFFDKTSKQWQLTGISTSPSSKKDGDDFFKFLHQFSQDSLFQIGHIQFPLPYHFNDPANDYSNEEGIRTINDWTYIEVIEKGMKLLSLDVMDTSRPIRDIFFRGVENGIYVHFTFKRIDGEWFLVKLIDHST